MEITESCLDAETLAAWVDGGLTAPELARVHTHVAGCARCQALVGTLARINVAAPADRPQASLFRWLGWLAPFAAAAAAVIIWVAIPGSNLDTRAPSPQARVAPAASPEQTTTAQVQAAPPSTSAQTPARAESALTAKTDAAAPAESRAKEMLQDAAAPPAALDKVAPQTEIATVTGAAPAAPAAPLPMPPATPAAPELPPSAGIGSGIGAGRRGGGPAARAQAGVVGGIPPGSAGAAFLQERFSLSREITSPDPMIRWRLAGSAVEISTNGGATWEITRTGVSTVLTAGAAPSATVVWVVGTSGVVLLSTDGRTWRRVPFPEMTNLSSIRARDARSVSVTTEDGRIFSTTDAGATWTRGSLQGF
ncbi:MAG TPA: zf-HC2 domain-containing protein [Vicinamibacterales bacterium]|nr:zf-HC2 domain-containing protein [Vicinamibacterales bacterium]